jgi:hypothetical protein
MKDKYHKNALRANSIREMLGIIAAACKLNSVNDRSNRAPGRWILIQGKALGLIALDIVYPGSRYVMLDFGEDKV